MKLGIEPIKMQQSGGLLLPPVQKLVATLISLIPLGKRRTHSLPVGI